MSKVTIKNTTIGSVSILVPEIRLNRTIKQGDSVSIEKELFEEALTYPGVTELFEEKDLTVVGEEDRIELGLQNEAGEMKKEDESGFEEVKTILKSGTPLQVQNLLANATGARKELIVRAATEVPEVSLVKIDMITKATGIDVLNAIKAKKALEK